MTRDRVPQLRPGPHDPLASTPAPAPRSTRRTWNIDITFPGGLDGGVVADVRGRDLRTDADGKANVLDELAVVLEIDPATGTIAAVDAIRASASLDALIGVCTRGGFGRRLSELFAHDHARRSLCYGPLEDLRGAQLVSGYAHLLEGTIPPTRRVRRRRGEYPIRRMRRLGGRRTLDQGDTGSRTFPRADRTGRTRHRK